MIYIIRISSCAIVMQSHASYLKLVLPSSVPGAGKGRTFSCLVGRFFGEMFNACEERSGKHYKILNFLQKRQKARSVKLSTHYAKLRLSNIFSLRIVLYGLWPAWPEIRLRRKCGRFFFTKLWKFINILLKSWMTFDKSSRWLLLQSLLCKKRLDHTERLRWTLQR